MQSVVPFPSATTRPQIHLVDVAVRAWAAANPELGAVKRETFLLRDGSLVGQAFECPHGDIFWFFEHEKVQIRSDKGMREIPLPVLLEASQPSSNQKAA